MLQGSVGLRWCVQLRVVYTPIEQDKPAERPSGEVTLVRLSEEASRIGGAEFCRSPRAIAATCRDALSKLEVVSESEFAYLMTLSECVQSNSYEHFFVLVEGERIEAVGAHRQDAHTIGVRFKTNLRTSQWYGCPGIADRVVWVTSKLHSERSFACGFCYEVRDGLEVLSEVAFFTPDVDKQS
jgi:hypothetical protein